MSLLRTAAVVAIPGGCLLPAACTPSHQTARATMPTPRPSTSTPRRPVAQSSFIVRASAVCGASNRDLAEAARHAFGNYRPTPAAWRTFMISTALPIISHRLDTLAALPRPDSGHPSFATLLSSGRTAVNAAKTNPRILSPASPAPFDQFDRLATSYGIPTCGVGA